MNATADAAPFQRVLLRLESDGAQGALLEAAARLAGSLELALAGLYVEDADLLAFAHLPFARRVTNAAARVSDLSQAALTRHFEQERARLQQQLTMAAARARVRHEFILRRGRPGQEIQRAVLRHDILVAAGRPAAMTGGPGGLLSCAAEALLLVPERPRAAEGPVAVTTGADASVERLVRLAARIALCQGRKLNVLGTGRTGTPEAARRARLRDLAAGLPEDTGRLVAEAADAPPPSFAGPAPGLLVMGSDAAEAEGRGWVEAGTPVLVVKDA